MSQPVFEGTDEQQHLAAHIFRIMATQGSFFANNAPIKQTLANLTDFLAQGENGDRARLADQIDAALQMNANVFGREEQGDEIVYSTSRLGVSHYYEADTSHTFRERLHHPDDPLPIDDISVVVSTSRPTLTTVEPVYISDYWQQQAGMATPPVREEPLPAEIAPLAADPALEPTTPVIDEIAGTGAPIVPIHIDAADASEATDAPVPAVPEPHHTPALPAAELPPLMPEPAALQASTPPTVEEEAPPAQPGLEEATPLAADAAHEPVEPAEPAVPLDVLAAAAIPLAPPPDEPAPEPEPEPAPALAYIPGATLTLPDGTSIDLNLPPQQLLAAHLEPLKAQFLEAIDKDPLRRIVRFGNLLYPEPALVSLGKNDLRRIRDDIIEAGEPLLDTTIINDLYYQRQADSEGFRFSLNYRLSREKDFEFVGVNGANLWSVKGLPPIGTKRIKASEMAQLASYLVEGYDDSLHHQDAATIQEVGEVSRYLTFFEWAYGILVLDDSLEALLPMPLLPDQRRMVLRIDSPQHYSSYLVEVRYPTGNRGGWLQGLEELFQAYLVAGALITLARTDESNVFSLSYEEAPAAADRLLTLDEKKNKFAFASVDYFCQTDPHLLLNQKQFGRLKNLKALPMSDRRKAELVLQHVFETVGEQIGSRTEPLYQIDLDTLYAAYNVLRPASRAFLRGLLASSDTFSTDDTDGAIYTYMPEPQLAEAAEESDEDAPLQWGYDEDDKE